MTTTVRRFDAAEFLHTEEDFKLLIDDAIESGDPRVMINALSVIVRSRGMSAMAEKTGISRKGLFLALSGTGNPTFENFGKIVDALGYKIALVPKVITQTIEPAAKKSHRAARTSSRRKELLAA